MSKPPDVVSHLSETLSLVEYKSGGNAGFWLYDETRGMNLSMRAKSERAAFIEALTYYQQRLICVEGEQRVMSEKVNAFVAQFVEPEDES